jgi:hypothetical protein
MDIEASQKEPKTRAASIVAQDSDKAVRTGWSDQLAKAAAILGAFFAVGQTASQIVQGYYQTQSTLAKSKQEMELAKEKSDADLASGFLQLILAKDTPEDKRSMLLDALSTLQDHPLQKWALARHEEIERNLSKLEHARAARIAALQEKSEADRTLNELQARIEENQSEMTLRREDTEATNTLQEQQVALQKQLVLARASQEVAKNNVAAQTDQTIQLLSDPSGFVRREAAAGLQALAGANDEQIHEVATALVSRIQDADSNVRVTAIDSVAALAPRLSQAEKGPIIDALIRAARDANSDEQAVAIVALGQLGAGDRDPITRNAITTTLLQALMKTTDPRVLAAASRALVETSDEQAKGKVVQRLREMAGRTTDPDQAGAITEALQFLSR